jgi:hypothetical protein
MNDEPTQIEQLHRRITKWAGVLIFATLAIFYVMFVLKSRIDEIESYLVGSQQKLTKTHLELTKAVVERVRTLMPACTPTPVYNENWNPGCVSISRDNVMSVTKEDNTVLAFYWSEKDATWYESAK